MLESSPHGPTGGERGTDELRSRMHTIRHSSVSGWIRLPAIVAAAALLTGCGASHQIIRVSPEQQDELRSAVPGKSRVRLRTGATATAYDLTFHDGTATWRPTRSAPDQSLPLREIDSLQLKNTARGVGRGLGVGLLTGFLLGVALETANGTQNDWFFDESERRTIAGIGLGIVGGGLGAILGGASGVWEDRYRFEHAAEETP